MGERASASAGALRFLLGVYWYRLDGWIAGNVDRRFHGRRRHARCHGDPGTHGSGISPHSLQECGRRAGPGNMPQALLWLR